MKQEYLKIKIMSLGAEAKIDRARERKLLDRARRLKFMTVPSLEAAGPYDHQESMTEQQKKWTDRARAAKVKMEAEKVLELQAQCAEAYSTFNGVRLHRIQVVKRICRHSHLAYGFLRGMPYSWMENTCHTLPNWGWKDDPAKSDSVLATALRFSGKMDSRVVRQKLEAWCQEADEHIKHTRQLEKELREEATLDAVFGEEKPVQVPAEAV